MYLFDYKKVIIDKVKKGSLIYKKICAYFPARIECEIYDFYKMHISTAGGGGYGFPVEIDNYIEIEISNDEVIESFKNKNLIKHWLYVMKKALDIKNNFKIIMKYDTFLKEHSGLGSSACTATIICFLINKMFNSPLTEEELIKLIGDNYAEEFGDKYTRMPLTGVSIYSVLKGQFVVVDGNMNLLFSKTIDGKYNLYLISPKINRVLSEPALGESIAKSGIESQINRKEIIHNNIIKSLEKNDWNKVFQTNILLQEVGCRKAFIENYENNGKKIKNIINSFKDESDTMVGLTSVGPLIYVLTTKEGMVEHYCKINYLDYKKCKLSKGIRIVEKIKLEEKNENI